jgi:hypothetical protein
MSWRLGNSNRLKLQTGDYEDINRIWENIKENIKTTAKESLGLHGLKQHTPWFEE